MGFIAAADRICGGISESQARTRVIEFSNSSASPMLPAATHNIRTSFPAACASA